jgi:hypothetical protein
VIDAQPALCADTGDQARVRTDTAKAIHAVRINGMAMSSGCLWFCAERNMANMKVAIGAKLLL